MKKRRQSQSRSTKRAYDKAVAVIVSVFGDVIETEGGRVVQIHTAPV